MNKDEARALLDESLGRYRKLGYRSLQRLLDEQDVFEVTGPSGARYQVEIHGLWDRRADGNLRILGSIDDGAWRALVPVTSDFIVRPDGTFVGES